jgi:addiction module RelE/StbE family toxin
VKIIYSPTFKRNYKKLPRAVKLIAEKKEKMFRVSLHNESLRTHKLHGKLRDFWEFSVNSMYRIIFEFIDENTIYFHTVGKHDIYK